jgi:hypothetical protein
MEVILMWVLVHSAGPHLLPFPVVPLSLSWWYCSLYKKSQEYMSHHPNSHNSNHEFEICKCIFVLGGCLGLHGFVLLLKK